MSKILVVFLILLCVAVTLAAQQRYVNYYLPLSVYVLLMTGVNSEIQSHARILQSSEGISCAGVKKGWVGIGMDNYLVMCSEGTRYRYKLGQTLFRAY